MVIDPMHIDALQAWKPRRTMIGRRYRLPCATGGAVRQWQGDAAPRKAATNAKKRREHERIARSPVQPDGQGLRVECCPCPWPGPGMARRGAAAPAHLEG